MALCVPALHGAWCAAVAVRAPDRDARRRALAGVGAAALGAALAAAFLAPVVPGIVALRDDFRALDGNEPTLLGPEGAAMLWSAGGTWWMLPSLAALPLVAAGSARAWRDRALRASLCLSLGGALVALAFPLLLGSWLYARFLAFTVPGIALLIGVGAQAVVARHRPAGIAACALAAGAWIATLATLGPRQQLREAVELVASCLQPGERAIAIGLPDDVHRWYAVAAGIDMPGAGPYGRDAAAATDDPAVRWAVFLYPRAMPEVARLLESRGWREEARLPGWIDWGAGEVRVLRRR